MIIELDDKSIDKLAKRIVELQKKDGGVNDDELLSTQEAARLLRVSPDRIRHLKDKFPHVKVGSGVKGRLLFYRRGLKEYLNP